MPSSPLAFLGSSFAIDNEVCVFNCDLTLQSFCVVSPDESLIDESVE